MNFFVKYLCFKKQKKNRKAINCYKKYPSFSIRIVWDALKLSSIFNNNTEIYLWKSYEKQQINVQFESHKTRRNGIFEADVAGRSEWRLWIELLYTSRFLLYTLVVFQFWIYIICTLRKKDLYLLTDVIFF